MAVTAVLFDVGETLVDEQRYWADLAAELGVGAHVLWAALGVTIERGEEHTALWGSTLPRASRSSTRLATSIRTRSRASRSSAAAATSSASPVTRR